MILSIFKIAVSLFPSSVFLSFLLPSFCSPLSFLPFLPSFIPSFLSLLFSLLFWYFVNSPLNSSLKRKVPRMNVNCVLALGDNSASQVGEGSGQCQGMFNRRIPTCCFLVSSPIIVQEIAVCYLTKKIGITFIRSL